MALAMVEADWDTDIALAVARELVLFLKRPGGQAQFSRHLEAHQAQCACGTDPDQGTPQGETRSASLTTYYNRK